MKILSVKKNRYDVARVSKNYDIICHECGCDTFRFNDNVGIGGFEFGAYSCIKCGNEVFIDHKKPFINNDKMIEKIEFKERKRLI